jgi:hypothetical protein
MMFFLASERLIAGFLASEKPRCLIPAASFPREQNYFGNQRIAAEILC